MGRFRTSLAVLLATVWTTVFAPVASASNGLMPTSNGPIQNGRGGVDIGVADTPLSMNTNPAGITRFDFLAMAGSLGVFLPESRYDDPENDDVVGTHAIYPIPNFAIVFHEDFFQAPTIEAEGAKYFSDDEMLGFTDDMLRPAHGEFNPHWSFGVGMFVQGGAGAHMHIKSRLYPQETSYFSNFAFLALTPTVAYHFSPKFSMGFSLGLNYSAQKLNTLIGQDPSLLKQILDFGVGPALAIDFAQVFRDLHDTNPSSSVTEDLLTNVFLNVSPADGARTMSGRFGLRQAKAYGLSGKFGMLWEPEPWLTVGAAYATRTWLTDYTGGQARIDFDNEISALGVSAGILTRGLSAALATPPVPDPFQPLIGYYDASIRDFNFPAQTAVGFSIHPPEEDWMFGMDVKYIQWAEVLQNFTVKLENGSNPQLNALVGSNDPHPTAGAAARAPSPDIRTSLPLNFKNQWVIALGGEYRVFPDLTLRGGYSFSTEFAPDDTYMPITPAIVQHHLHMGFTYQVFPNTTMDWSWEHGFEQDLNVDRSASLDDLDNSTHRVSHDTIWTGFTVRY